MDHAKIPGNHERTGLARQFAERAEVLATIRVSTARDRRHAWQTVNGLYALEHQSGRRL